MGAPAATDPKQIQDSGHHRYIRARVLDLAAELQANGSPCQYLHFYCDELRLGKGGVTLTDCGLRYVHIFARSILGDGMRIDAKDSAGDEVRFGLVVFYENAPVSLSITRGTEIWAGGKDDGGSAGRNLLRGVPDPRFAAGVDVQNVTETELDSSSGLSGPLPSNSNLSKLLVDTFGWASEAIFSTKPGDEDRAKSMFRFIVLCTRASASHATLCSSAQRVLSRLELPSKWATSPAFSQARQRFDVPVLTMERYKALVLPMINFLGDIEEHQRLLESTQVLQAQQVNNTKSILENMALTLSNTSGKSASGNEALSAIKNAVDKRQDLKGKGKEVDNAFLTLAENLNEHLSTTKKSAAKETGKGIFNVLVAQGKAAAGLASGDIGSVIDYVVTFFQELFGISKRQQAKEDFKKIMEAFQEQARQLSDEVRKATRVATKTTFFSKKSGNITEGETEWLLRNLCDDPIDYFGLLTRWKTFQIDTRRMLMDFDGALADLSEAHNDDKDLRSVPGMNAYADELEKLIIFGTTVLDTERQAQTTLIAHLRSQCEQIERSKVKDRIATAASAIGFAQDFSAQRLVAAELEQQAIKLKSFIFVALFESTLSYVYRASLPGWPANFSVDTRNASSSQLKSKLILLENMFKETDEKSWGRQTSPIPVRVVHEGNVLERFKREKTMVWVIPSQHRDLNGWYNVRCTNILEVGPFSLILLSEADLTSAEFEINKTIQSNIAYQISIGPWFLDKDVEGTPLHFTIEPQVLRKVDNKGGWSGNEFIKPPVCCFGSLEMGDNDGLDIGKVEKVTVSFEFAANFSQELKVKERGGKK